MRGTEALGVQPADELISAALISFDESGVHHAWTKALGRRGEDPEGALTAAKTLLETVCKHIIDEAGGTYGDNDDLPKLYIAAAECLNLAPSQHTEKVFKSILGNCQSVVGLLASLRNRAWAFFLRKPAPGQSPAARSVQSEGRTPASRATHKSDRSPAARASALWLTPRRHLPAPVR
jgi:hypothetical protein